MADQNDLSIPVVDFTDVKTKSFDPVPRGEYVVEVDEADIRDGKKFPYLNLMYTILEGEFEGRKLFDICSFSPKALWKLKGLYEAMGLSEEELAGEIAVDIDEFPGVVMYATVTIGKDRDGNPRNQIRSYDLYGGDEDGVEEGSEEAFQVQAHQADMQEQFKAGQPTGTFTRPATPASEDPGSLPVVSTDEANESHIPPG